jgi:HAE1 family hydrophobic/amphiphilic exporter-1
MNVAKLSINKPVATIMLMLVVVLLGVVSFTKLDVDLLPNINPPVAAIITRFPGASAEEVQDLVTIPVEAVAGTTSGVKEINSISQEEMSLVILMFDWGKKVSDARADISAKLDVVKLPEGASKPATVEFDPTLLPVIQVTVSKLGDLGEVTEYVKDKVKPRLEAVEGVAAVDVLGGTSKQVNVWLDPVKLASCGLTQDSVAALISSSNLNYPLGDIRSDGLQLQFRMLGKYGSIQDIKGTVVGYAPAAPAGGSNGAGSAAAMKPVTLQDVATVEEGYAEVTSLTRANGNPGVTLAISREGSANTVTVSRAIRKELNKISQDLGIDTIVSMDQARFIELAVRAVEQNLLMGAGLAVLVLLLFLRDIRTTLVIAISIPFSLIATFALMYGGEFTLNLMTLAGLALGVGMLVDNSIVVIENIFRHTQEGEDPRTAAEAGTREVAMAITASTLTTVIVFVPVVFVGGITGIIFRELAWVVTFSLMASLVVALTVVPMLASRWFGRKAKPSGSAAAAGQLVSRRGTRVRSDGRYGSAVRRCLGNRGAVVFAVLVMLAGTAFLARRIPSEFLPVADEGAFTMNVTVKPGTPLEDVDKTVAAIEGVLSKEESVDKYSVTVGQSGELARFQSSVMGSWDAQVLVTVTKETADKKETGKFMESLEKKVDKLRGDDSITYNLTSSLMMMAGDIPSQVKVRVGGPDLSTIASVSNQLVEKMKDVSGLKNVRSSLTESKPEVHLVIDKEKALRAGLTPAQIALAVSRAVKGQTVSRYQSGDTIMDVVVRYQEASVLDPDAILGLTLPGRSGKVALKDIAKVENGSGPLVISRLDRRLSATVSGQISGRSLGSVSGDVSDIISGLDVPGGYHVELGGASQIMSEGFSALGTAFVLAAILVYMVMAASFESLGQPLILMLAMPLAAAGTVLALYSTGHAFGITAFIGVIILAGVVVNNGIVMVDFMNQLRAQGLPLGDAIVEGASKRLRPVLMTSLTTIVGLIPMATGLGEGGELEAPLALALMGGLISGTFLTLFVIPVVYSVFTRERAGARVSDMGTPAAVASLAAAPAGPAPARVSGEPAEELTLGPAFDSKDMAELVELLGKLFTSIRRKSV